MPQMKFVRIGNGDEIQKVDGWIFYKIDIRAILNLNQINLIAIEVLIIITSGQNILFTLNFVLFELRFRLSI